MPSDLHSRLPVVSDCPAGQTARVTSNQHLSSSSSNMAVSRVPSPPLPEVNTPVAENWCYTQVRSRRKENTRNPVRLSRICYFHRGWLFQKFPIIAAPIESWAIHLHSIQNRIIFTYYYRRNLLITVCKSFSNRHTHAHTYRMETKSKVGVFTPLTLQTINEHNNGLMLCRR